MNLFEIALGNVRRRKAKALLVVVSLALGVATVIALVASSQAMRLEIGAKLDEYGANILIVPNTQQLTLSYGGISIPGVTVGTPEFDQGVLETIKSIKNYDSISVVSPKLVGAVPVGNQQVLLVGVDFQSELRMKKWWHLQGERPTGPNQAILGSEAASRLSSAVGDSISLSGTQLVVASVLAPTGGPEDDLVFADLAKTQSILGKRGKITFAEASALCNTCPIEDIVSQISDAVPGARVTALKQTVKAREDMVRRFDTFAVALSVVVLLASGLSVLTTMLSSINERTREIGIFRAIGYRRSHVSLIVMGEAALLSAIGGIAGFAAGQGFAEVAVSRFVEGVTSVPWNPALPVISICLATLLGISAAAYPAWRASKIDPAEALRFI